VKRPHFGTGDRAPAAIRRWGPWLLVGLSVAVGFAWRVPGVYADWVNPDEGIYFSMATMGSWDRFWREALGNAHPPLYYLILRGLTTITDDYVVFRWVSLVCGCLWIPAVFLFLRETTGGRVGTLQGLIGAALITISPGAMIMSQVIRSYALLVLCQTIALYAVVRFLRRSERWAPPLFLVSMTLALLTHYSTLLLIAGLATTVGAIGAAGAVSRRQLATLLRWSSPLAVLAVALYFGHIRMLAESAVATESVGTWLRAYYLHGVSAPWLSMLGLLSAVAPSGWEFPCMLLLLAGVALAALHRLWLSALFPVVMWTLAAALGLAELYPFGASRHSLYLVAPLLLPISYSLAWALASGWRTALVAVALAGAFVVPDARSSVGDLLGARHVSRGMTVERSMSRRAVRALEERLAELRAEPGAIVMSYQAFYQFMPLYHREREGATMSLPRPSLAMHFRWDRRDVLVWNRWLFKIGDGQLDDESHLVNALPTLDRLFPDVGLLRGTNVVFLFGGWDLGTAQVLFQYAQREPDPLVGRHFLGERILLMECDVQRLVSDLEARRAARLGKPLSRQSAPH